MFRNIRVYPVRGGLGNQLLILIAAMSFAKTSMTIVDISFFFGNRKATETQRNLAIATDKLLTIKAKYLGLILRVFSKVRIVTIDWGYYFQEIGSEEWLENLASALKQSNISPQPLEEKIAIHVRLGDYLNSHLINTYLICDENYFLDALNIELDGKDPSQAKIEIYSDSPGLLKSMYPRLSSRGEIIDLPEVQSFEAISSAKSSIISNSTFSLTAALSGPLERKRVYIPIAWNELNKNTHLRKHESLRWI